MARVPDNVAVGWVSAERVINSGADRRQDLEDEGELVEDLDPNSYGEACNCESCQAYRAERSGKQAAAEPAAAKRSPRRRAPSREKAVKLSAEEIEQLRGRLRTAPRTT